MIRSHVHPCSTALTLACCWRLAAWGRVGDLVRVGEEANLESSAVTGEVAAFGAATIRGSPWYMHNVVMEALFYS
jgi:hypothetical protein